MELIISSLVVGSLVYLVMLYIDKPPKKIKDVIYQTENEPFNANMFERANLQDKLPPDATPDEIQRAIVESEAYLQDKPEYTDPYYYPPKSIFTHKHKYVGWVTGNHGVNSNAPTAYGDLWANNGISGISYPVSFGYNGNVNVKKHFLNDIVIPQI